MAWIESHQSLRDHPKVKRLARLMDWDIYTAVGRLHFFWYWCVDYAENGDLRKYNDADIAEAIGLDASSGKKFVDAMVECGGEAGSGFIDRQPYFRVHDWWDYIGLFLQRKYGERRKDKWQTIQQLYNNSTNSVHELAQPTNLPTNLPSTVHLAAEYFAAFYQPYPKKVARASALKAWLKIPFEPGLIETIVAAVVAQSKSEQWRRDNGKFIPHPATWLNQKRWEDEIEPPKQGDPGLSAPTRRDPGL